MQQEIGEITAQQLQLTSEVEIVGGSEMTFSVPPSFSLPDSPGIFPEGVHIHRAGNNTVRTELILGGVAGSVGQYELSDSGILDAPNRAVVGNAGLGTFLQSGGANSADTLVLGRESTGAGRFELTGGNLTTARSLLGSAGTAESIQSGDVHRADTLAMSEHPGSTASYRLDAGTLDVEAAHIPLGVGLDLIASTATFDQYGGTHDVNHLFLASDSLTRGWGTYNLYGGALRVQEEITIEDRDGSEQFGGLHTVNGTFRMKPGGNYVLHDGTALYVRVLDIKDRTLIDPENLLVFPFLGDAEIYYDASQPENDYLAGLTYGFADGSGALIPQIPEPGTIRLAITALPLIGLAIRRRPVRPTVA